MKSQHKFFTFLLLGIFLSLILIVPLVKADTLMQRIFGKGLPDLSKGLSDDTKATISKFLLGILVVLIVYSVTAFLPFFPEDKPSLQWIFSIVIAVLGFMFISAGDIKYILTTYEALGIMLASIIPLIILLTFTYKLREKQPAMAGIVNKILIIGFIIYAGFKWLFTDITPGQPTPTLSWLYPVTVITALIWLGIEKKVWEKFRKEKDKAAVEDAKRVVHKAAEGMMNAAEYEKQMEDFGKKYKVS